MAKKKENTGKAKPMTAQYQALRESMFKEFDMENQFTQYLDRVKLDPEQMHPTQYQETKRAFYGAFGQALINLGEVSSVLNEHEVYAGIQTLVKQIEAFWEQETGKAVKSKVEKYQRRKGRIIN